MLGRLAEVGKWDANPTRLSVGRALCLAVIMGG
jgi:hypothetical protein